MSNLNQSIFKKVKKDDKYAQISNELINNRELSYKALGIITYILAKPNDWQVYISDLIRKTKDGEKSVRSGINELIKNNYMQRYKVYDKETGKVNYWETLVSEEKFEENQLISHVKEKYLKDNEGNIVMEKIISNNFTRYIPIVLEREEFLLCQKGKIEKNIDLSEEFLLSQKVQVEKLQVEKEGQQILSKTNKDFSSSSKDIQSYIKFFEENICELKKTTLIKFVKVLSNNCNDFIHAVIEECACSNVKSYKGFQVALESYINRQCKTKEDVVKAAAEYRKNKKEELKKSKNSKKNAKSTFNNFDQRTYDFEDLERKLLGWE